MVKENERKARIIGDIWEDSGKDSSVVTCELAYTGIENRMELASVHFAFPVVL